MQAADGESSRARRPRRKRAGSRSAPSSSSKVVRASSDGGGRDAPAAVELDAGHAPAVAEDARDARAEQQFAAVLPESGDERVDEALEATSALVGPSSM
jgi:hypothetical protein